MRSKQKRKIKIAIFFLIILFFLSSAIFLYNLSPKGLVELIGVENGYIIAFLTAFISATAFISFPYYLVIIALAAGGLNPIILGLVAGLGIIAGDSTSYILGYTGREILPKKLKKSFQKAYAWSTTKPPFLIAIVLFLYGALIPFPNDIITIPTGAAHHPYWKIILPLGLGNISFNMVIAFVGFYGLSRIF